MLFTWCMVVGYFVVTPLLAVAVMYIGFNIQNAYSLYFGVVMNGEEWTQTTMRMFSLDITAGILYIVVYIVIIVLLVVMSILVLISYPESAYLYVLFIIQNACSFIFGWVLNGEEWAHTNVPSYLRVVAGILYIMFQAAFILFLVGTIFAVLESSPQSTIAVLVVGLIIQDTYSSYVGWWQNGVGWTHAIVPIYLFIFAGIFAFIDHALLCWAIFAKKRELMFMSLTLMVVVIEIIGWSFLKKHDMNGPIGNAMGTSMEKYYDYNQPEPVRNISVQFWENLQTDFQCCGIFGPSDWIDAAAAPAVGFVPNSCCLAQLKSGEACTNQITTENVKDLDFVSEFIHTKGCLREFDRYYSVDNLVNWAIALGISELSPFILSVVIRWGST